jgi:DNA-binding transcriptional MerR regulator
MTLTNNWYTIDEAASKFGLSTNQLQEWTDIGLVRKIEDNGKTIQLNGEDIEREMNLVQSV